MRHAEHPVPVSLAGIVEAVWTLEGDVSAGSVPEPVIPDGRAEIVVHFGDRFERWDDGRPGLQPEVLVAGQLDRPLLLRATGVVAVLGIRLAPGGAPALVGMPQAELRNLTPAASDVCRPLAAWLEHVRDVAASPAEAARVVCDGLARLARPEVIDPRVSHAVRLASRPGADVDALARAAGVTCRQLERLFARHVGLAPRALLRIRRLQRALAQLERQERAGSPRPGTDAALAGGYADQAHFVREFRAFTGGTPTAHLLRRAALTGVFVDRSVTCPAVSSSP